MRRLFAVLMCVTAFLFLVACSSNNTEVSNGEEVESLQVELTVPDEVSLNKEYEFHVSVMENSEEVVDADQVQFEIWKGDNKKESEFIEAFYDKDGIYSIRKTFTTDGIYTIQSHVFAHGKSVALQKSIIVGTPSEKE